MKALFFGSISSHVVENFSIFDSDWKRKQGNDLFSLFDFPVAAPIFRLQQPSVNEGCGWVGEVPSELNGSYRESAESPRLQSWECRLFRRGASAS